MGVNINSENDLNMEYLWCYELVMRRSVIIPQGDVITDL